MEYAVLDLERQQVLNRFLWQSTAAYAAVVYRQSLGPPMGSLRIQVACVAAGVDPFARQEVAHGSA